MDIDAAAIAARDRIARATANGHTPEIELPDYPLDIWPDALGRYFETAARCVGAPVAMATVPAQSIIAGLIGNSRPIIAKAGYPIPPAIWTFDLAEPGTGKSPMLGHARRLVTRMQYDAKQFHDLQMGEYVELVAEHHRGEPDPPKPAPFQHYYTDNATIESLAPICEYSAGITMIRDELVGWLHDLNAYRSGRGSDRQAWLTFWSGQEGTKTDRKSSGVVMPAHAVVCITGSIQPGRFAELAGETAKDGMLARFLGAMHPDVVVSWNDYTLEERDLEDARAYLYPLRKAPPAPAAVLSERAIDLYREWDQENAQLTQAAQGPLRHLLSKLPLHLLKLVALLHCVYDPEAREREVNWRRMRDGIRLLEYHRQHTEVAYSMIAIPANRKPVGAKRSILWAIERMDGVATLKEIRVKTGGHMSSEELVGHLDALVAEEYLDVEVVPTGGRPATKYTVRHNKSLRPNPAQGPLRT